MDHFSRDSVLYFNSIYLLFLKNSSKEKIILFIFFFLTMNILNSFFNDRSTFFLKLLSNSFAPWLYMFVVGAMVYKSKKILNFIIKIPYFIGISLLIIFYFLTKDYGWGNDINPIVYESKYSNILI